jgi:hypothetical protein
MKETEKELIGGKKTKTEGNGKDEKKRDQSELIVEHGQ